MTEPIDHNAKRYWHHPESDCLWTTRVTEPEPASDGFVEELTADEYAALKDRIAARKRLQQPDHSAHAVYAPSSAHRWTQCTASATAIQQAGIKWDLADGADEDGTDAHNEIERILGPLQKVPTVGGGDFIALTEQVDFEHPAALGIALVVNFAYRLAVLSPGRFYIEQRLTLTDQIWGRGDVVHWDDKACVLTVVDYKNGFVPVEAEENEQLRIYAAASIYTHKLPAKWIRYAVVQPNDFRPVPRVKQWHESAADLYAFAERTARIPTGPLTFTFGDHCRYCPLFGICDASRDVLTKLAPMLANPPSQIPPHQVAQFLQCKRPLEDWFKAAEKAQLGEALKGKPAPGMKVVRTQPHRAWKDEAAARDAVAARFGVAQLSPPTPAQAEKIKGADAEWKAWVEAAAHKPEGGPVLAFADDKRPVFEAKSVEKMFGGVKV